MFKTKTIMYIIMMLGSMITVSSASWMGMWAGMEMNMMSIIPLIKEKSSKTAEACMIYFLVQSLGSALFMMSCIMSISELMDKSTYNMLIMVSMLMKMGAAPFHMWFPEILSKISWYNCMLLMTWQKLAPLSVINSIVNNKLLVVFSVIASVTVGSLGGLNQSSLKKIMAYSSIHHLGWMLAVNEIQNESMKYLMIYSAISVNISMMFMKYNMNYIHQINIMNLTPTEKIVMISSMLSLGGLPPFIGFLPKWMALQVLTQQGLIVMMMIMIMSSLINLFYYTRILSLTIIMQSTKNKWMKANHNKSLINSMLMVNMSLPLMMIMNFM
uniref:NADH-ubiquinone oxidoreductase chain 2 n=1 Tax=Coptosoma bifarium TaxID=1589673 RepID=B7SM88_COPBI|nr:NADH dehydrogenase subunit 2 [Coptosoma bifarium]ABZ01982.1 NADH dehydrogenase subunit 2 [Coptosoma bifarium]